MDPSRAASAPRKSAACGGTTWPPRCNTFLATRSLPAATPSRRVSRPPWKTGYYCCGSCFQRPGPEPPCGTCTSTWKAASCGAPAHGTATWRLGSWGTTQTTGKRTTHRGGPPAGRPWGRVWVTGRSMFVACGQSFTPQLWRRRSRLGWRSHRSTATSGSSSSAKTARSTSSRRGMAAASDAAGWSLGPPGRRRQRGRRRGRPSPTRRRRGGRRPCGPGGCTTT
mmetsp:Transcript_20049/g.32408  ORF Transcript_20049/g.32408 Transcript_20049/m.32408 type:complete len:224 (-) Transcript_20049:111-782(-)